MLVLIKGVFWFNRAEFFFNPVTWFCSTKKLLDTKNLQAP